MTDEELEKEVAAIRNGGFEQGGDIIPVLENAVNYGDPWRAIFLASIEEIKELRQIIKEYQRAMGFKDA